MVFFEKNVIILSKNNVKLTKKLFFFLLDGKVKRSRSLRGLKIYYLPREKSQKFKVPNGISQKSC